jgi:hypothetical protein
MTMMMTIRTMITMVMMMMTIMMAFLVYLFKYCSASRDFPSSMSEFAA